MPIPKAADRTLSQLIAGPPIETRPLKKRVAEALAAEPPGTKHHATLVSLQTMLALVVRKTTPFHVRLIHAASIFVLDREARLAEAQLLDEDVDHDVLRYVARKLRRPELGP